MNLKQQAKNVESRGRFGDGILVHMNPVEVDALAKMSPTGKLTVNPDTGQPEAFLPLLGALAGSWLGGSMGMAALGTAAMGGLGAFAGSMIQGDSLQQGLLSGLTSFGLGSMFGALGEGAMLGTGAEGAAALGGEVAANTGTALAGEVAGNTIGQQVAALPGASVSALRDAGLAIPQGLQETFGRSIGPSIALPTVGAGSQASALAELGAPSLAESAVSTVGQQVPLPAGMARDVASKNFIQSDFGDQLSTIGRGFERQGPSLLTNAIKDNPLAAISAVGGVAAGGLGNLTGTQQDYGSIPEPEKAAWIEEQFPTERNRIAAPAGFKHGVQPEHRFFDPVARPRNVGFSQGGEVQGNNVTAAAVAAIKGVHPEPQLAIQAFVQQFGQKAFSILRSKVIAAASSAQRQGAGIGALVSGQGDGLSDEVDATINGKEPVKLSEGEHIIAADVVSGLGNGSTAAGSEVLEKLSKKVRKSRTGIGSQPPAIDPQQLMAGVA